MNSIDVLDLVKLVNTWRKLAEKTIEKSLDVEKGQTITPEMKHVYIMCERAKTEVLLLAADDLEELIRKHIW